MSVTTQTGLQGSRKSSTFLIRSNNPVMVGHQVHGFKVLPGLSYIDLLYQFFRRQGHAFANLELRNLAIHRPMVLPGEEDIEVTIDAIEIRPGAWQLFVDGLRQEAGKSSGEQVRYAVGEMHLHASRFEDSEHLLERPVPHQRLETDTIYAAFRQRGLVHSGFMQVHGLGFSTGTHAYADVGLGEEASASMTRYMFHPALLDGAVTCACGMLPGAESGAAPDEPDSGELFIPLSYDAFRATDLIRERCIARIHHDTLRRRKDLFLVTVDFLDENGRKVGELKNLALKALRRKDAISDSSAATGARPAMIASFKNTPPQDEPSARSPVGSVAPQPSAEAFAVASVTEAGDPEALLRETIAEAIAARIGVPADRIDPAVGYYEMGLDSVGLLQLVALLESRMGVSLSPTLLFEYTTIDELVAHLAERHGDAVLQAVRASVAVAGEGVRAAEAQASSAPVVTDAPAASFPDSGRDAAGKTDRDIAIIGMAGRFPQARNLRELWRNLEEGRDCITEIPAERWDWRAHDATNAAAGIRVSHWGGFIADADSFDAHFFRVTPRAAEIIDPQERQFLEVSWEAIEDAGYTPRTLAQTTGAFKRRPVGVFAGVMHKDYLLWQAQSLFQGQHLPLSMSNAPIANRVSYFCNFHGPSVVVDTLCSSSLTAVHMAAESLHAGECEVAIAGGVNLSLHPGRYLTFALFGMHASDGRCRAFGAGGDGYVAAEGVGAVVLKPLASAIADGDHVYAVIRASAANHVGTVSGISVPSPVAQADLIAGCLAKAGINPRTMSCMEAHGTGTSLGDPIEIDGLTRAFRMGTDAVRYCAISSIKSNIGHAESAAGVAGLIKLALQLHHRRLVPSLHGDVPNPHIDWAQSPFVVQTRSEHWRRPSIEQDGVLIECPRRGAVSSFGAAGSNAHVVLEEYAAPVAHAPRSSTPLAQAIVPLSAQSDAQLRASVERLLAHLSISTEGHELHRIAYTLQIGREPFDARVAFIAADVDALRAGLEAFLCGQPGEGSHFAGHGNQRQRRNSRTSESGMTAEAVLRHIADGRADRIADYWAQGGAVDWPALYPHGTPVRVPLPTYPFAKERYWIDPVETGAVGSAHAGVAVLHPLLHQNTSNLDEQRFTAHLQTRDFFLRDHVVKGAHVLPGVAYLEMAHAALKLSTETQCAGFALRNVVWARPVVVGAEPVRLDVSLFRTGEGTIGYEVHSRDATSARVVHFQGTAAPLDGAVPRFDLPALQARCRVDLPVDECYRLLDASGLSYGSSFRVMRSLRVGSDADGAAFVLAELALTEGEGDDAARFDLHPSIVDGALQSAIGLLLTQSETEAADSIAMQPYLPYALERLDIFAPCNGPVFAIVRKATGNSARLRKLDVAICDADGTVCAYLNGFAARVLDRPVENAATVRAFSVDVPRDSISDGARETRVETASEAQSLSTFAETWYDAPLQAVDTQSGAVSTVCVIADEALHPRIEAVSRAATPALRPVFCPPAVAAALRTGDVGRCAEQLADAVGRSGPPEAVVVLWPSGPADTVGDYRSLHTLLQALAAADLPKLRVVLAAVCRTPRERAHVDAWFAIVPSLKRLLPHRLQIVGVVDYAVGDAPAEAPDAGWHDALPAVFAELLDPKATSVFLEGGRRLACRLEPTSRASAALTPTMPSRLREGATYLITGGLGGLGLRLAQRLARRWRANLLLLGRSAPDAAALDALDALEADGARVRHVRCDVADPFALRHALEAAQAELGPLAGVFHVAGVSYAGSVLDAPFAEFERVLAPKIAGSLALDEALSGVALDFVCHFSSSSAVLGDFGACAYAIANRFQAACAQHMGGARHAIEWPLWQEGGLGMGDAASTALYLQSSGQRALGTEEGFDLLERLLVEPQRRQLVLAGDPVRLQRMLAGAGIALSEKIVDSDVIARAAALQPVSDEDAVARRMLRYLCALLGEAIKLPVERVSPERPLDEYGFDSIMAMQMTNALEASLGSLSKTLFFEHHDLLSLNRFLVTHHRAAVCRLLEIDDTATAPAVMASATPAVTTRATRDSRPLDASAPVGSAMSSSLPPVAKPAALHDEIAIVGISARFPKSDDLETFWRNLREGVDCVTEVPAARWNCDAHYDPERGTFGKLYCRWGGFLDDIDAFDPLFFNMSPVEAQFTDPQQRLFLETVWRLLESGGYTREALQQTYGGRVGVYVGSMYNQYGDAGADLGSDAACTSPQGGIANRVSYFFGLHGPSIAVDTMCSSAFVAIHMACADLRLGHCGLAIAGGVNLTIHPKKYITLSQAQMLASDARARSFGVADGYLPAEGVGAVLLKPLQRAIEDGDDVLAIVKGSALNHGGRSNGYSVPNPVAQAQVIEDALRAAGAAPETIGYVEAAANGSPLGDAIEMVALRKAFEGLAPQTVPIGAVKSNLGHAEAASGIAQLAKVLLQMRHGELAPSILAEPVNPNIDFQHSPFRLQREAARWHANGPRRALINSFGAGGANACLVVEAFAAPAAQPAADEPQGQAQIVVLSARSFDRLKASARALADFARTSPDASLADIAYTLQCGREAMACRLACVVDGRDALLDVLEAHVSDAPPSGPSRHVVYAGGQEEAAAYGSFTGGNAGAALLETFLRDRDLDKLAMFWAYGGKVPWRQLHPRRRRTLALPGYPFARDRYWLPPAVQAQSTPPPPSLHSMAPRAVEMFEVDGRRVVPVVHPLLHANSSDLGECRFSTTFTGEELYSVRDTVRGLQLIPNSVHFEMLRAAVAQLTGRMRGRDEAGPFRFVDMAWSGPIEIEIEPVTAQVALRMLEGGHIACELYTLHPGEATAEGDSESLRRLVHCRGILEPAPTTPEARGAIDLDALRERCSSQITTARWYEMLMRIGLEYGTAYAGNGTLRTGVDGDGRTFLVADVGAADDPDAEHYGIPPVVLNTALQAATLLLVDEIPEDDGVIASVPAALRCDAWSLLAPVRGAATIHVHSSATSLDRAGRAIDIEIHGEDGGLLARISGVSERVVPGSTRDEGDARPSKYAIGRMPLVAMGQRDVVAPRNKLEETLQEIWHDVLGFAPIGVFDSFLDLGGTSLSATQVIARTNDYYQLELQPSVLLVPEANIAYFTTQIVAELARQASASA